MLKHVNDPLPPLHATLALDTEAFSARKSAQGSVQVQIEAELTELGVLQLALVNREWRKRWRLDFNLRQPAAGEAKPADAPAGDAPKADAPKADAPAAPVPAAAGATAPECEKAAKCCEVVSGKSPACDTLLKAAEETCKASLASFKKAVKATKPKQLKLCE